MNHTPRTPHRRRAAPCWSRPSARGATACGSGGGNPLAAKPYDAADQVAFNAPDGAATRSTPTSRWRSPPRATTAGSPTSPPPTPQGRYVRGRAGRRRQPLAQHRPAGRRRPLHRPGEHRGRATAPRAARRSTSTPAAARKKRPEGHLRPGGGHVRRRPAHHRRTQPPGQGQGRPGRRRARPEGRLRARRGRAPGTGWTTRPCTTGPRSTGPPTPPSRSAATSRASRSATGSTAATPSR